MHAGYLGVGNMGQPMAGKILDAGHTLSIYDTSEANMKPLLDRQEALLHACEAETSMIMALAPELVDSDILSQMHGPLVPGLSAIPTVNEGVYRWRQLQSRSPNGVIGNAATASAAKGEKLAKPQLSAEAVAMAKAVRPVGVRRSARQRRRYGSPRSCATTATGRCGRDTG